MILSRLSDRPGVILMLCLTLLGGCASGSGGSDSSGVDLEPKLTLIDSKPEGASVYIDGGFVGTTPAKMYLPSKRKVEFRLEFPGYVPVEDILQRRPGTPKDAPDGVGWEPSYFRELLRKG